MGGMQPIRSNRALCILAAIGALGCKGDPSGPPPPPPVATTITFVSGSGQSALAGTVVPIAPVAHVVDQNSKPMPGASVVFTVTEGGGTVSSAAVITDAAGNSTSPPWTLGKSVVPQSLHASTSGIGANVSATVSTSYTVNVRFFGPPMSPAVTAAFTAAATRISAAVVGDVPDIPAFAPSVDLAAGCGFPGLPTAFSEPVDDIIVFASVEAIDGPDEVLASSGPCAIRGNSGTVGRQTFIGVMEFDIDDIDSLVARGNLTDVIQHEMLHTVGIGTLWATYGLLADAGTPNSRFTGVLGIGACVSLGGAAVCPNSVPVENGGGSGTADGHWRESVFRTELMTGFITTPTPGQTGVLNPFSTISIQSLADLGYQVNPSAADPYVVPNQSASRFLGIQAQVERAPWEKVVLPTLQISGGRVGKIPVPRR
jgi:hypothetical protein